ncbi:PREDICTED: histone deacetylase complex subunit SAP18-like, partial [Rhagoletis zephyria]|uniref:histone deacetylase complex subunit SAP18-like n=1 Tax=Rhagoletis zephyria TaxID=28612 RepID=UPI0008117E00
MASSVVTNKTTDTVDREKKCPLLLRVFINNHGRHHHLNEFARGNVPSKEVQIYTWMDATLKELTALVKEVNQECRKPGSRFDFALVFPDSRANTYRMREIGSTVSGRKDPADMKTLGQARFQIGDYFDVAINIPGDDRGGGGDGQEKRRRANSGGW